MPSRTERLAAPTFLGKLSKKNILHSRNDGPTLTKWLGELKGPAKGWKAKDTIKQKTEFLAASMFLHRHGLVKGRLEALSKNEIDTLATLLCLDRSKDKKFLVKQLRKFCEDHTDGMSDSSDSSNTGEGSTSTPQTSPQELFGFAKRRMRTASSTPSEDEGDNAPQGDKTGGTRRKKLSKTTSSAAKFQRSPTAEQDSFSSSSSHDEDAEPELDRRSRKKKKASRKEPVTRKIGAPSTKQAAAQSKRKSGTVGGQAGTKKSTPSKEAGAKQKTRPTRPTKKVTSKKPIDISDSEVSVISSEASPPADIGDQSSEDDGEVSDTGHDDFQRRTAQFAALIAKKCRCRLCRTYHSAKRLTAEQLIRGGKHYVPPFRRPASTASTKALREWVAALFWCSHREEGETWENLRNREREYIIRLLDLPQWSTAERARFAEPVVANLVLEKFRTAAQGASTGTTSTTKEANPGQPGSGQNSGNVKKHSFSAVGMSSEHEVLRRIESLAVNPAAWLSESERKDLVSARRLQALSPPGAAVTFTLPYADYPWEQPLMVDTHKPFNILQLGRMLNVAARTFSESFSSQLERLAADGRRAVEAKIYKKFDAAFEKKDLGGVLIATEQLKAHVTDTLEGAVSMALQWHVELGTEQTAKVLAGRQQQVAQLKDFYSAVSRGVRNGADTITKKKRKQSYIIGAWAGFFEGFRAGQVSQSHISATIKRGRKMNSGKSHSRSGKSSSEDSDISEDEADAEDTSDSEDEEKGAPKSKKEQKKRKTDGGPPAQTAGSGSKTTTSAGGGKHKSSGAKCKAQVHFMTSVDILGPKLGTECTATKACFVCNKSGHWNGECPKFWFDTLGKTLPGYGPNGRRLVGDWDANKNPTKATAKKWVKFLSDSKNFPQGGIPALETDAPTLNDFKKLPK